MDTNKAFTDKYQQHLDESGNCVIKLDLPQYFFYQSDHIDIHAPDGTHLECVGHIIKESEIENSCARLKEQIFLVECLLSNINHDLKLPSQAVAELADLFYRMQKVCGKYMK